MRKPADKVHKRFIYNNGNTYYTYIKAIPPKPEQSHEETKRSI